MTKDQFHIQRFDPSKSKEHCLWLLVGPRNTGKSVLLMDLLYHTHRRYDMGVAMTATESTVDSFKNILPHRLIFTQGYDFAFGEMFLTTCRANTEKKKVRANLCILDDCMYDPKVMKSATQKCVAMNGRHNLITQFNTAQYCMSIPSDIRANTDYVLCLRESTMANKRRLYEYFFGMFDTFKEFNNVFTQATRDFGALVLDKTSSSTSVSECVKWYVTTPDPPVFKIGRPVYFHMSSLVEEANKVSQKKKVIVDMDLKII